MRIAIAILLGCILTGVSYAQDPVKKNVRGRILLSDKSTPAAYIHLSLHAADSSLLKGTLTDSLGNFEFTGIKRGKYLLSLAASKSGRPDFIGAVAMDSVSSGAGTIYINEKVNALSEVKVLARKPFLERHLDRLTINLEGSTLTAGNSALEALGKLPGMNLNGNSLFFNGMGDILFLVDGKGYRSGSEQGMQVLRGLRAENIEKVEIFTNPPARFDAQGSTVVNIVLKKDKMYSSVSAGYVQRLFPAAGVSGFNYQGFSFNSNLSYGFRKFRFSSILSFERSGDSYTREFVSNELLLGNYTRDSRLTSQGIRFLGNFRLAYIPNTRNEFSAHFSYVSNPENDISSEGVLNFYNASGNRDSATRTSVQSSVEYRNPELLLHYLHRFDDKGLRTLSIGGVKGAYRSSFGNTYLSKNIASSTAAVFNQEQEYDVDVSALKADYSFPLKGMQADMGIKSTFLDNSDRYAAPEQSLFTFREVINAGYASLRKIGKKFSYQAGIRAEHTNSSGQSTLLADKTLERDYFNIFPSLILQWTAVNKSKINFSANRRIVRPSYSDFNPYRYRTFYDPNVSQAGDVNLRPQYINRFELSYSHKALYASVSYADRRGVRTLMALPDNNGAAGIKLQAVNINTGDWTGLLTYSKQIKSWWQSTSSSNIFYYRSFLFNNEKRQSLAAFISTNHSLQLSKKLKADVAFRYFSPARTNYWRTSGFTSLGAGASVSLFNNNLSASLSFEDLLGTNKVEWIYDYGKIRTITTPLSNGRLFRLSLTYRFRTGNLFQSRSRQGNDFGEIRYGK